MYAVAINIGISKHATMPLPALIQIANPKPEILVPSLYFKAAGEALFLCLSFSWIITLAFNPDFVGNNPVKARLGYNNVCVGFDSSPSRYVATPLLLLVIYLGIRFVFLDTLRAHLERNIHTKSQFIFTVVANCVGFIGFMLLMMIIVLDPITSDFGHLGFFIQFIVARWVVIAANFYEAPEAPGLTKPQVMFLVFYTLISIILPILYIVDFADYNSDEDGSGGPALPWGLVAFFDMCWFVCLPATTYFLPPAPSIHVDYSLVASTDSAKVIPALPPNRMAKKEANSSASEPDTSIDSSC